MDDFPEIEEDTPPSEEDIIPLLPQPPPQEENVESSAQIKNSSRRWKAPARALQIRKCEYLYLKKAYNAVQEEQNNQKYYEAMYQDNHKIQ